MNNPQEEFVELKKYFKKLHAIIQYDVVFDFISFKLVKKNKVDDILCCIEGCIPTIYKKFLQTNDPKKIKSNTYYMQLKSAIQNRFFWSTTLYSVKVEEVNVLIPAIINALEHDLKFLYSEASGMI